MKMNNGEIMNFENLSNIRKNLHRNPELSEMEKQTSSQIISYLKDFHPSQLITKVGGHGILCIYDFHSQGPCIVFRAELDALPIHEKSNHDYQSIHSGVSHACGHDGHMTILLGLAQYLSQEPDEIKGKIVLLFQPAEETAIGAKKIIKDNRFHNLHPTHIFGLHNLPRYPLGAVLLKNDVFASASQGLILRFHGTSSHAGHPDQGLSPLTIMLDCIRLLQKISKEYSKKNADTFITIIHMKLGERAFGTAPGEGVIMATCRSFSQKRMDEMTEDTIDALQNLMKSFNGTWEYEWVEVFPSVVNKLECMEIVTKSVEEIGYPIIEIKDPFNWSEDFSYYLNRYPGAFFGLGAGENHHVLHHPSYDFPDELIEYGIELYKEIIRMTQKKYDSDSS